jgi:hypothetical protein
MVLILIPLAALTLSIIFSNCSSVLDLSNSPTSQISKLTSVNLSMIDTTMLDQIISENIPSLKTNLTMLNNSLTVLYNATQGLETMNVIAAAVIIEGFLNITPSLYDVFPQNQTNRDLAAITDFRSKMGLIFNTLNLLINTGGNLDQISAATLILRSSMVGINSTEHTIIVLSANERTPPTLFLHYTINQLPSS